MKLTFRIPSKAIQYGYAELELEMDRDPTPEEVAVQYMEAVSRFQIEEMNFVKRKQGEAAAKLDGAEADAKAPAYVAPDGGPEDTDEAAETLAEGLGGVTVVEDEEAPWAKAPAAEPVVEAWDVVPTFDWS